PSSARMTYRLPVLSVTMPVPVVSMSLCFVRRCGSAARCVVCRGSFEQFVLRPDQVGEYRIGHRPEGVVDDRTVYFLRFYPAVVRVHAGEESREHGQQEADFHHAESQSSYPVDDAETGEAEHLFEQVADEGEHEDADDEYRGEAQHGGQIFARSEPVACRPAETHGEENAQHEPRDAARLYDDALPPPRDGGDQEQNQQYDV